MAAGICGNEIPPARLERWPWAKTCSMPCADGLAIQTSRKARKAYRNRRRDRRRIGLARRRWTATAEPRSTPSRAGVSGGLVGVSLYMILRARNVFSYHPPHLITPQPDRSERPSGHSVMTSVSGNGCLSLLFSLRAALRTGSRLVRPSRCALSSCSISRSYWGSRVMPRRPASARFCAARACRCR